MHTSIEMVVMDWAGTAVDFGSMAPILALEHVFAEHNIAVSRRQLRQSMGLAKKDHIREILAIPRVAANFQAKFNRVFTEADVELLYARFTPRMLEEIAPAAVVIPGIRDFAAALAARKIKLGATTGYTTPMMEVLIGRAAEQGYSPALSLCPDDVAGGRPYPWMCLQLAIELRVSAIWRSVKIGDTPSDMAEGRNAGMWTIGVTTTGNAVGLPLDEWRALSTTDQDELRQAAKRELIEAGAHFVVDSAANALPILDQIESRLTRGERP